MAFEFDKTRKNAFGETEFYKGGKKVGYSSRPIFGSSVIRDVKGNRIGTSRDMGFGLTEYRDSKGKRLGHSSSLFGSSSHFDSNGNRTGSSMDNPFAGSWTEKKADNGLSSFGFSSTHEDTGKLTFDPYTSSLYDGSHIDDDPRYLAYYGLSEIALRLDSLHSDYSVAEIQNLIRQLEKYPEYLGSEIEWCNDRINELNRIAEEKRQKKKYYIRVVVITCLGYLIFGLLWQVFR